MGKKLYILLFASLFSAVQLYANVITIKGYVKQANGTVVANKEVNIATYLGTSTTSCSEVTVTTNSDGFYSKEVSCTGGDIRKSRISVKNCDGTLLIADKEVPVSKVVEANFTVCVAPPACAAKFTAEAVPASSTVPAFSVKFNSNISEVGSGDKIANRTWDFHDGTPLLADRVDPLHSFPGAGTYEVCLTIKTTLGCESRICKQVTIQPNTPVTCAAKFTFEKLGPKKFRFNSTTSVVNSGDNIVERKWDFRDGITSNEISPAHEFAKPGSYEVCLTIKTAKGCESKVCSLVKVEEVPHNNNAFVEITSLYPAPVHENLNAVVFSKYSNNIATISIVDTYGKVRSSKKVTLAEGSNQLTFPVNNLVAGSYFIVVSSQYGTVSKTFYKV